MFIGSAAVCTVADGQAYAAGRDMVLAGICCQAPAFSFAHRHVKEVYQPSGDPPELSHGVGPTQAILCSSWQSASPHRKRVMLRS